MPDWGAIVSQVGIASAAAACNIWLVWWFVTRTIPDKEKASREEMAEVRKESIQTLKDQRAEFSALLREQQAMFVATLDRIERRAEAQHAAILGRLDQLGTRLEKLEDRVQGA